MLAATGVLLLVLSFVIFGWTLRAGKYRRYPHEQFVLVGAATVAGLVSVIDGPTIVETALFTLELLMFLFLVYYMSIGARFRRGNLSISVGDRFPSFKLLDSKATHVDSESLRGKTALYLFYRGPW